MIADTPLDMRDPDLIRFVNSATRRVGDVIRLQTPSPFDTSAFTRIAETPLPGFIGKFPVQTALQRHYRLLKNRQPIADYYIQLPLATTVAVTRHAALAVSTSLAQVAVDAVTKAFQSYAYPRDGELSMYAASKLAEFNQQGGPQLSANDFVVYYEFICEWKGSDLDLGQDRWLHELFESDARSKTPDLVVEGNSLAGSGFELRFIGDVYLDTLPAPTQKPCAIPLPPITFSDPQLVDQAVVDFAEKNAQKAECAALSPTRLRITSVDLWPEFKYELEWVYYPQPCGGGFHWIAVITYSRVQRRVLYASLTFPQSIEPFRQIFEQSLKDAAGEAAVVAVVFSDFEAGVSVFKNEFWRLIKERTLRSFDCLLPELILVEETSEWVRGSFVPK